MHRSIRSIRRLLVAAPLAATVIVVGAGGASAAVVDPASTGITLDTSITFFHDPYNGDALLVAADGSFSTSFIENTTLALQVVGTETWTDANGTHTQQIEATPSSIQFASKNHVEAYIHLHANSTVQVNYTAEDAGFAPTPFTGSCAGTGLQLSPGNVITTKTC